MKSVKSVMNPDLEITVEASRIENKWLAKLGLVRTAPVTPIMEIFSHAAGRNQGSVTLYILKGESVECKAAFPSVQAKDSFFADIQRSFGKNTLTRKLG